MRFLSIIFIAAVSAFTPLYRGDNRLFLDSADVDEWQDLTKLGIFYGITTNPTLLERSQQPCTVENLERLAKQALGLVDEFMCQTWGDSADQLYETGMKLSQLDRDRIVVKVPVTTTGVQACHLLHQGGVRTCLTAAYDAKQAVLAAAVGAEYIAPYVGRVNDAGKNGLEECMRMMDVVDGLDGETRILCASIRSTDELVTLAEAGLDTFTVSPQVIRMLLQNDLTAKAAADFEEAAKRGAAAN